LISHGKKALEASTAQPIYFHAKIVVYFTCYLKISSTFRTANCLQSFSQNIHKGSYGKPISSGTKRTCFFRKLSEFEKENLYVSKSFRKQITDDSSLKLPKPKRNSNPAIEK
jgi:hypothetical protein